MKDFTKVISALNKTTNTYMLIAWKKEKHCNDLYCI